jgi:hypothetical protein
MRREVRAPFGAEIGHVTRTTCQRVTNDYDMIGE